MDDIQSYESGNKTTQCENNVLPMIKEGELMEE